MVAELVYQMSSVMGVVHYSVVGISHEAEMLVSVWTFAEHRDLFSVAVNLVEMTVSLVLAVVVVIVHLVIVVWEVRE